MMEGADAVDGDDEGQTPRYTFSVGTDEECTVAVVQAVATVLECDPLNLPELLYEAVDVDALNALFRRYRKLSTDTLFVSFEYCGHVVDVAPERIVVSSPDTTS